MVKKIEFLFMKGTKKTAGPYNNPSFVLKKKPILSQDYLEPDLSVCTVQCTF